MFTKFTKTLECICLIYKIKNLVSDCIEVPSNLFHILEQNHNPETLSNCFKGVAQKSFSEIHRTDVEFRDGSKYEKIIDNFFIPLEFRCLEGITSGLKLTGSRYLNFLPICSKMFFILSL